VRRKSREVKIGNVVIGGPNPIAVQSMTKTDTRDVESTVSQILELEEAGCEIIRVAVPDMEAAEKISDIKRRIHIPLVADIHFDPRLAIESILQGADKIRLNPSNIEDKDWIKKIAILAKERSVPIRVGANLGSFRSRPENVVKALVDTALNEVRVLNDVDFDNIVISIKTSDVLTTVEANEKIASLVDYPIHLGVTEAGPLEESLIKSSAGIGYLLLRGIGDTIRYSISAEPIKEVDAGFTLLKSLHLRESGLTIVSCPTCGRCEIDLFSLIKRVKADFGRIKVPVKVAIMGCVVNGPGEAREADIGLAGGRKVGVIFKKGKVIKTVPEPKLYDEFKKELIKIIEEKKKSI
jgi:(E)-4-hydroxy-3-methylbut-2-enyl-diphosphate synthase